MIKMLVYPEKRGDNGTVKEGPLKGFTWCYSLGNNAADLKALTKEEAVKEVQPIIMASTQPIELVVSE